MIWSRLLAWCAPYFLPAAATAFAAALAWGGVQTNRLGAAKAQIVEVRNLIALERAAAAAATLEQTARFRVEETRRSTELAKAADEAELKLTAALADAGAASAAAGRLSDRITAVVAASRRATCNPAAAPVSAPAVDSAGMLADVLGRADARAGLMARLADARGIAGSACERAYDALTP